MRRWFFFSSDSSRNYRQAFVPVSRFSSCSWNFGSTLGGGSALDSTEFARSWLIWHHLSSPFLLVATSIKRSELCPLLSVKFCFVEVRQRTHFSMRISFAEGTRTMNGSISRNLWKIWSLFRFCAISILEMPFDIHSTNTNTNKVARKEIERNLSDSSSIYGANRPWGAYVGRLQIAGRANSAHFWYFWAEKPYRYDTLQSSITLRAIFASSETQIWSLFRSYAISRLYRWLSISIPRISTHARCCKEYLEHQLYNWHAKIWNIEYPTRATFQ